MQSVHGLREPSVPEFRIEDSSVVLPPGYGESKHVSERIYPEASRRSHVPTIVYRVGQIAGPTTNAELASTVAVFHWTFARNMSYRTYPVHYTCIGSANISQKNNHAASTTFYKLVMVNFRTSKLRYVQTTSGDFRWEQNFSSSFSLSVIISDSLGRAGQRSCPCCWPYRRDAGNLPSP